MKSLFEQLGDTYTRQGDYCLPDVYTARNVAAPSDASRRRTLPDGGAASNIKRRESLEFQGFWDSRAGAGGRFHPPPPKSTFNILQRRILWTTN